MAVIYFCLVNGAAASPTEHVSSDVLGDAVRSAVNPSVEAAGF